MTTQARRTIEAAARLSYGRLLALLASRARDIAAAEDALAEAFAAALATWPDRGIPDNPEAWLLVAARRTLGHARARRATAAAHRATIALLDAERTDQPDSADDPRLDLMFVCAHPAIDPAVQTPLMLQTILGLDAARIAAAFLVSPAAMGARLVRAKAKIRLAAIPFARPEPGDLEPRTTAVLAAIYAAYGTGWDDIGATDPRTQGLATEAIWLGRVLNALLPRNPETGGLLALMLHCQSRAPARRGPDGAFIPLHAQKPALWDHQAIVEAETLLRTAAAFRTPGRYQTEAAIQSLHAQSIITGQPLREPLIRLYDLLAACTGAPSVGVQVARATAYAEAGHTQTALAMLDQVEAASRTYQPWWAARARTLWLHGAHDTARRAAHTAAGLTEDPAIRTYLLSHALFR